MTIQNRANEILDQMTAFSKESYTKEEYLPELLKLQSEIVRSLMGCKRSSQDDEHRVRWSCRSRATQVFELK